jgi:hypothetical protein
VKEKKFIAGQEGIFRSKGKMKRLEKFEVYRGRNNVCHPKTKVHTKVPYLTAHCRRLNAHAIKTTRGYRYLQVKNVIACRNRSRGC